MIPKKKKRTNKHKITEIKHDKMYKKGYHRAFYT